MYARFSGGQELFFDETLGEKPVDLLERSDAPADYHALKALARTRQLPYGYTWGEHDPHRASRSSACRSSVGCASGCTA